ncbi:MAG: hypothetical protein Kow0042_31430 [Calditrichia bacterium]
MGAGSGQNITGVTIGGIGAGAGGNISGITIGGIGAGCGGELQGLIIGGIGVGASQIQGIALGGIGVGGDKITGAALALGIVKVKENGQLTGLAFSAHNRILGKQSGISLGILNYAWKLEGIQIGLLNYVRDNPKFLKLLPLINFHFD